MKVDSWKIKRTELFLWTAQGSEPKWLQASHRSIHNSTCKQADSPHQHSSTVSQKAGLYPTTPHGQARVKP